MDQHLIDKFNDCKLVNHRSTMPYGDKQHPVSIKKVALRELPSNTSNIIAKPLGNSPVSFDRRTNVDFLKILGIKRQQPDSPSNQIPLGNAGTNGQLVYVRRKLVTKASKITSSNNAGSTGSPEPRKCFNVTTKESNIQQNQIHETKAYTLPVVMTVPPSPQYMFSCGPSISHSFGKPIIELAVLEPNDSMVTTVSPVQVDSQQPTNQHRRERFLQLQMFLKQCDRSSQDEYIRMLRSLPEVGRSRHAVELEKRAIQLMLE